ncbi:MAG: outer membrane protein assembly factor BamE [Gammaproteobacteria bacterium]
MMRSALSLRSAVTSTQHKCLSGALALLLTSVLVLSGCVYRIDIQQGNLLEQKAIDQVEVGMTESQVRFLLGTPMVADTFHQDRWDYMYYLRKGRARTADKRWFIVHFSEDVVSRLERDVPISDKP